jgi:hypothetical protein
VPDLDFSVAGAQALPYAAVPTIAVKLRIVQRGPEPVRSIALCVQVRIASTQRAYTPTEQDRLLDVFGASSRWGQTLKSLLWTVANVQVPAFTGETVIDLPVACTYDFDVVNAKYFDALQADGRDVPIELLFSGTVFYAGELGLQVEQISWAKEARFAMPVQVWKDVMALYFPNSAWLRVHRDTFDRLRRYSARNGLPTWDAALEHLLRASDGQLTADEDREPGSLEQETAWTR